MDTLAYPIFSLISAYMLHGYKAVMDVAAGKLVTSITLIALAIEGMYIAHYGYLILLQKSTEEVPNPSIRDLLYHCVIVIVVLAMLKSGVDLLQFMLAFRTMIIESFTGNVGEPAAKQIADSLADMDAAFGVSNLVNTVFLKDVSEPIKNTAIGLAVVAEVAPQLVAGIMVLMNELMVRTGIALFPFVFYSLLYKSTKSFFATWLNMMFAASIQMGILAIVISIAVKVTKGFLAAFALFTAADHLANGVGGYIVSELQESLVHASLGITLTALMVWVPANAAAFAGTILTGGTTKSGIGAQVSAREVTERKDSSKKDRKAAKQAYVAAKAKRQSLRPIRRPSDGAVVKPKPTKTDININKPEKKEPIALGELLQKLRPPPKYDSIEQRQDAAAKVSANLTQADYAKFGLDTDKFKAAISGSASSPQRLPTKTASTYENPLWTKQDKLLGKLKYSNQQSPERVLSKERAAIRRAIDREFGAIDYSDLSKKNIERIKLYGQLTDERLQQRKAGVAAAMLERESVVKQKITQATAAQLASQGKTQAEIVAEADRRYLGQLAANDGKKYFERQAQAGQSDALAEMVAKANYNASISANALNKTGVQAAVKSIQSGRLGSDSMLRANTGTNSIVVNANQIVAWSNPKADAQNKFAKGKTSSPSEKHALYHELGHLELAVRATSGSNTFTPAQTATAAKLSGLATRNPNEFGAEYIAGVRGGKEYGGAKYNKDVHELFNSYAQLPAKERMNAMQSPPSSPGSSSGGLSRTQSVAGSPPPTRGFANASNTASMGSARAANTPGAANRSSNTGAGGASGSRPNTNINTNTGRSSGAQSKSPSNSGMGSAPPSRSSSGSIGAARLAANQTKPSGTSSAPARSSSSAKPLVRSSAQQNIGSPRTSQASADNLAKAAAAAPARPAASSSTTTPPSRPSNKPSAGALRKGGDAEAVAKAAKAMQANKAASPSATATASVSGTSANTNATAARPAAASPASGLAGASSRALVGSGRQGVDAEKAAKAAQSTKAASPSAAVAASVSGISANASAARLATASPAAAPASGLAGASSRASVNSGRKGADVEKAVKAAQTAKTVKAAQMSKFDNAAKTTNADIKINADMAKLLGVDATPTQAVRTESLQALQRSPSLDSLGTLSRAGSPKATSGLKRTASLPAIVGADTPSLGRKSNTAAVGAPRPAANVAAVASVAKAAAANSVNATNASNGINSSAAAARPASASQAAAPSDLVRTSSRASVGSKRRSTSSATPLSRTASKTQVDSAVTASLAKVSSVSAAAAVDVKASATKASATKANVAKANAKTIAQVADIAFTQTPKLLNRLENDQASKMTSARDANKAKVTAFAALNEVESAHRAKLSAAIEKELGSKALRNAKTGEPLTAAQRTALVKRQTSQRYEQEMLSNGGAAFFARHAVAGDKNVYSAMVAQGFHNAMLSNASMGAAGIKTQFVAKPPSSIAGHASPVMLSADKKTVQLNLHSLELWAHPQLMSNIVLQGHSAPKTMTALMTQELAALQTNARPAPRPVSHGATATLVSGASPASVAEKAEAAVRAQPRLGRSPSEASLGELSTTRAKAPAVPTATFVPTVKVLRAVTDSESFHQAFKDTPTAMSLITPKADASLKRASSLPLLNKVASTKVDAAALNAIAAKSKAANEANTAKTKLATRLAATSAAMLKAQKDADDIHAAERKIMVKAQIAKAKAQEKALQAVSAATATIAVKPAQVSSSSSPSNATPTVSKPAAKAAPETRSTYKHSTWQAQNTAFGKVSFKQNEALFERFDSSRAAMKATAEQTVASENPKITLKDTAAIAKYETMRDQLVKDQVKARTATALASFNAIETGVKAKFYNELYAKAAATAKQIKQPITEQQKAALLREADSRYYESVLADQGKAFIKRHAKASTQDLYHDMAVQAQYNVVLARAALIAAGFDVSVRDIQSKKTDLPNNGGIASARVGTKEIRLNPNNITTWADPGRSTAYAASIGFHSSNSPLHILHHEITHLELSLHSKYTRLSDAQKAVATKVSKYAATNANEFIAEYIAGLRGGRVYSQEVHDLFNQFKHAPPEQIRSTMMGALPVTP